MLVLLIIHGVVITELSKQRLGDGTAGGIICDVRYVKLRATR